MLDCNNKSIFNTQKSFLKIASYLSIIILQSLYDIKYK